MAIADRINEMYTHVGDVYDTITNVDVNTGKNLFNKDTITKSSYLKEDGTLLTGTSQEYNTSDFIPVEPNTTYYKTQTLSPRTKFYDANKQALNTSTYQDVPIGGNSGSFTTPNNAYYFRFTINTNPTTGANINLAMINKGSTALPYEPYTDNPTYKNIENIPKVIRNSYLEIMNNGIDKIWNNWEKVTGSGTELSLSPTLEAPMKNVLNGNTIQETTIGYNLLPVITETQTINGITVTRNEDNSITLNGTATDNFPLIIYDDNVGITLNGHYEYYVFNKNNKINMQGILNGTITAFLTFSQTNFHSGFTYDTDNQLTRIFTYVVSGSTFTNHNVKFMITKGTQVYDYEKFTYGPSPNPQYPQDIHVVSGDNIIKVTGRNLAEEIEYGDIIAQTGAETSVTTAIKLKNYIPYDKNSTYYLSVNNVMPTSVGINLRFYNKNKEYIGYSTLTGSGRNFYITKMTSVIDDEAKYFRFRQTLSVGPITSLDDKVMITTINNMNYEPYSSNSYNINLPVENKLKLEFNNDSDVVAGVSFTHSNNSFTLNGTTIGTYKIFNLTNKINIVDGLRYTFSANVVGTNPAMKITLYFWNANNENLAKIEIDKSNNYVQTKKLTFTTRTDMTHDHTTFVIENLTNNSSYNLSADVQFEIGSQANSIVPYETTPIELCDFNTYKDNFLRTSGKNLFDKDNTTMEIGTISATGTFDYSTERLRVYYIEVDENTTYTLSTSSSDLQFVPYFYNSNKTFLSYDSGWKSLPYTITTPSNTKYLALLFKNSNNTPSVGMIGYLQLEKGTTATDYEPYGSGEWYLKKDTNKVLLNGTETISSYAPTSLSGSYQATFDISTRATSTDKIVLSEYFASALLSDRTTKTNICYTYTDGLLRIANNLATTMADFKTWLSSNNTKIYYVLATPTYTKTTYEPLIEQLEAFYNAKSKNSQTNITQENNDLPFIIDSTMLKEV